MLVVDDDAVNRLLARALLEHLGWRVQECEDGGQALRLLQRQRYEVVLLDISLPDICGSDLCSAIRAACGRQLPRVVAYTAMAMPSERPALLAAGFDDILFKPVNMAMMRAAFGRQGGS